MRGTVRTICFCLAAFPSWSAAAFRYFDPADSLSIPKTLSATGFFPGMTGENPVPEAVFFEINAALWSDGAWKQRWILPPPGKSIPYDDTADFFDYPDSTVFVKNFWLEAREGDSSSRMLWETRLLMKKPAAEGGKDWHGFSYRWNTARSEAFLVSPTADFDTLFHYTDSRGRRTYKRWRFPSTSCNTCHKTGSGTDASGRKLEGRAVLGFYPAQLKRPSGETAGSNQVEAFFARGLFTGTAPDSAAMAQRFMGIHEPVPPSLGGEERRKILDNKSRSYLAANCSGCHGYRGIAVNAIGEKKVNFDFYRLSPAIPFAHFTTQKFSLNDTATFLPHQHRSGRAAFIDAVVMAGLDTGSGKPWNMDLPPFTGDPLESLTPALVYPGYPSLTELLYRQVRRASSLVDSALLYRNYYLPAEEGDTASQAIMAWLFKEPWGSSLWEDSLKAHGWNLDSVFAQTGQFGEGGHFWRRAPEQMPELATYLPDTAALNVLAEWVRQYPQVSDIRSRIRKDPGVPLILGRTLAVPAEWIGPVSMSDLRGRKRALTLVGPGIYRLPDSLRPGIYVFRNGRHSFRIAVF